MNLPQIRVQSTMAQIDIRTQSGQQVIKQPAADLDIQQPAAELYINRNPSRLTIDQTRAWEEMGSMHVFRAIETAAQQGYQDYLMSIAQKTQEGDELMMIENGGSAIASQAKRNSEPPIYDFNIGWIPSHGSVRMNYQPGTTDIQWNVNKPIINVRANKPIIDYYPGKVDINLKQHASLNIDFINLQI